MNVAGAFLQLVLCTALVATSGFAASKKIQHDNGSRDWNDSSLVNGDLPGADSSMSSASSGFQSSGAAGSSGPSLILDSPSSPDHWKGGTGNWSDGADWSAGLPGAGSDVTIHSGGNDTVTLDVSSTISTLKLGGVTGSSTLVGGPAPENLTITGALTIGQNGNLCACAGGGFGTIAAASLINRGSIIFETSGDLQISGNANNSGFLQTGFETGGHVVNIAGRLTNSGQFLLDGHGDAATLGSMGNSGSVDVSSASALTVNGNVNNTGTMITGDFSPGGNTITVTGKLTNQSGASLTLNGRVSPGPGDTVTIGSVNNGGLIDLENGSTLTVSGNVNNTGNFYTSFHGGSGGTNVSIDHKLTNNSGGSFVLYGPGDTATLGSLNNAGFVDVENGSTLQINGGATNSGILGTSLNGLGGANTLNITGKLTNNGTFELFCCGTTGSIGSLVNNGFVETFQTSVLTVNGGADNFGTISVDLGGTVNIAGKLTNEAVGQVVLEGGTVTSGSAVNDGLIDFEEVPTLTVNGNVNNSASGMIVTGYYGHGTFHTLNITGTLTNDGLVELDTPGTATIGSLVNGGTFELGGSGGNTATIGNVVNNGFIAAYNTSVLTVNGNVDNFGTIGAFGSSGTVNIAGTLTNELNIEPPPGQVILFSMTLNAANVVNNGLIDFEEGGTLTVSGDVNNSGMIATGTFGHHFGNTLTINGTLTNSGSTQLDGLGTATIGILMNRGSFSLSDPDYTATIGGVTNSGSGVIDLENASALTVSGDVNNSGTLSTSGFGGSGGNALNVAGNLNNNSGGTFSLNGSGDVANVGMLNNLGYVYVGSGTTLNVGNPGGIGIVEEGSRFDILGNFNCPSCNGGLGGSAFSNLTLIQGGTVILANGQETTIMPQARPLRIFGTLDASLGSTITVQGDVDNHGLLATGDPSYYGGGGNTLNITGALTNNSGGAFTLNGPGDTATIGSVVNSGLIDLENGSALTVNGDVNNGGNIYTSDLGGSGHDTITIDGELTFSPGGQVKLFNPTDQLIIHGSMELLNGSAVSTPTLNNGGTINVDNLSTLLVGLGVLHGPGPSANYTQLANGTLGEMISSTNFGVINVNGSALLDGTLAVLLQGGYNPAVGSMYKFLLANPGQINGTFASILNDIFNGGTEKWLVTYDNADGVVELTAEANNVPEPATLLVLIPGLLGMAYGLRRRSVR